MNDFLRPRRDPFFFARNDPDAREESRRQAMAYLLEPEVFAAAFRAVSVEEAGKLLWLLPEHRQDLVLALTGDREARTRLATPKRS
jgi:hypothetical protein